MCLDDGRPAQRLRSLRVYSPTGHRELAPDITGERVALGSGGWRLEFAVSGAAYVVDSASGAKCWVKGKLVRIVGSTAGGRRFLKQMRIPRSGSTSLRRNAPLVARSLALVWMVASSSAPHPCSIPDHVNGCFGIFVIPRMPPSSASMLRLGRSGLGQGGGGRKYGGPVLRASCGAGGGRGAHLWTWGSMVGRRAAVKALQLFSVVCAGWRAEVC